MAKKAPREKPRHPETGRDLSHRKLDWPKTIAALERGAMDERASAETREKAARTARIMKAIERARKNKMN